MFLACLFGYLVKTKYCNSVILKIICVILHLNNSLLELDKIRTIAQRQQLIHQGLVKKHPECILYFNISYIHYTLFTLHNIVTYLSSIRIPVPDIKKLSS